MTVICDPKTSLCNHRKNPCLNIYTSYKKYYSDMWRVDSKYSTIHFKVINSGKVKLDQIVKTQMADRKGNINLNKIVLMNKLIK